MDVVGFICLRHHIWCVRTGRACYFGNERKIQGTKKLVMLALAGDEGERERGRVTDSTLQMVSSQEGGRKREEDGVGWEEAD